MFVGAKLSIWKSLIEHIRLKTITVASECSMYNIQTTACSWMCSNWLGIRTIKRSCSARPSWIPRKSSSRKQPFVFVMLAFATSRTCRNVWLCLVPHVFCSAGFWT